MAVETYDPKAVKIIFGTHEIQGFADGTFLNIEYDENAFQKVVGADGGTSRAKMNNNGGLATITIKQTSPSNDFLSGIALSDRLSSLGILPFFVTDKSGKTLAVSAASWIQKPASSEFSKEITNREWAIELADLDMFVGGND